MHLMSSGMDHYCHRYQFNIIIGFEFSDYLATSWGFPKDLTRPANARVPGQPAEG